MNTIATIYGKPGCMQCVATKREVDKLYLPTAVIDVSTDDHAGDLLTELGYRALPVVVTAEGHHWTGHRPDRIQTLAKAVAA